jgi:sugar-phosphatase
MHQIKAVIFDMDGLLVNTEPLWRAAEKEVFASLGLNLSDAELAETTGIRLDQVVEIRYAKQAWNGPDLKEVEKMISYRLIELIKERAEPMAGADAAIRMAYDRAMGCALASSSPMIIIDAVLDRFSWTQYFNPIQSAERELYGKPHPAVYLRTCRKLGMDPKSCVALEDSIPGMIAAKAAQMRLVAIPDAEFKGRPELGLADACLESLEDLQAHHLGL